MEGILLGLPRDKQCRKIGSFQQQMGADSPETTIICKDFRLISMLNASHSRSQITSTLAASKLSKEVWPLLSNIWA